MLKDCANAEGFNQWCHLNFNGQIPPNLCRTVGKTSDHDKFSSFGCRNILYSISDM